MTINKQRAIFIAFMMSVFLSAQAALPFGIGEEKLPSLAPMLEKTMPGVVNISTKGHIKVSKRQQYIDPFFEQFFGRRNVPQQQRQVQSLGSGVIVDSKKGYILTNHHVVDGADEISVKLRDGREFEATLVGSDAEADVAVIQIKADDLTEVELGDSSKLRVGDFVVAIGNPFGLGQTVTSGIVSALGRTGLGIEGYEDFIQTDASINPGNSGGALVDLNGHLIGINTAIVGPNKANVGIGFAIPVDMVKTLMDQLVEFGEVQRGQLGVHIQDLTDDLAEALDVDLERGQGVVVSSVEPGTAAQKAGIETGDVIISVNGKSVKSASQLRNAVGLLRIGDDVKVTLIHDGDEKTVSAELGAAESAQIAANDLNEDLKGATLSAIVKEHPLYGKIEGVMVAKVEQGSSAAEVGLREGDIIVSANRHAVSSLSELQKIADASSRGLLLNIRRGNSAFFVLLR
ncbi:MAG: DegQ family serine endoprotease [bacterium]